MFNHKRNKAEEINAIKRAFPRLASFDWLLDGLISVSILEADTNPKAMCIFPALEVIEMCKTLNNFRRPVDISSVFECTVIPRGNSLQARLFRKLMSATFKEKINQPINFSK